MTRARLADAVVASAGALLLVISAVGLTQVGDDQRRPTAASGDPNTVTIVDFAFEPGTLTTTVGTEVVWTNEDSAAHTVTSEGPGPLASGNLSGGDTYKASFSEPGSYAYFCAIHPSMRATVEVS